MPTRKFDVCETISWKIDSVVTAYEEKKSSFTAYNFYCESSTISRFEAYKSSILANISKKCTYTNRLAHHQKQTIDLVCHEKTRIFTCHIWNMREVLVSCREKWKKFIAGFHVLGLFMAKKLDLSEKKISVCHAPGPLPLPSPLNAKFVPRLQPRP
jgi:hypothetical protein